MKPVKNIILFSWGKNLFWGTGWMLALLLGCWAAPRMYHRLITDRPATERENWRQTVAARQQTLSAPWQDPRPLIILAGDSHIELGNWYDLLAGRWAVRNGGLARAKIADVTALVAAIGDAHPRMVVLMCGINNLNAGIPEDNCIHDYDTLLTTVQSHLQPEAILVLSVMPMRETVIDRASHNINMKVEKFNTALADCCRRQQAQFLNLNAAVAAAEGGLADKLTLDGLHLNPEGYRRLAAALVSHLPSPTNTP